MIIQKDGNLLTEPNINIICHQANLFHTFGAGIAAQIKKLYPKAYEADCKTVYGDKEKLGTYSLVDISTKLDSLFSEIRYVANCYTQNSMGAFADNTNYDAIEKLFTNLHSFALNNNYTIGVPHCYGSGISGGDWTKVYAIFEKIFKDSPVKLLIMKYAP